MPTVVLVHGWNQGGRLSMSRTLTVIVVVAVKEGSPGSVGMGVSYYDERLINWQFIEHAIFMLGFQWPYLDV